MQGVGGGGGSGNSPNSPLEPGLMGHHLTLQSGLPHIRMPTQRDQGGQENRACGGRHLFPTFAPFLSISPSLCSDLGVLFLSPGLTWSGAVLRSSPLWFLQAAVIRLLQQPPASVSLLVLAAGARDVKTCNDTYVQKQVPTCGSCPDLNNRPPT